MASDENPVHEYRTAGVYSVRLMATYSGGTAEFLQEDYITVTFIRGDANGDRGFDIGDPIAILGYLFLNKPLNCHDALDGNDSGTIDISDPIYLLGHLFNKGPAPPPPFPNPGTDPTEDELDCQR